MSAPDVPPRPGGSIHALGVGGSGVGALARLLAERGARVAGEDDAPGFDADAVRRAGLDVVPLARRLAARDRPDVVVRSAAIGAGDARVRAARAAGIPVLKYAEALGRVLAGRRVVAVAGTHGKTSVTALVAHLLARCGARPGWLVGGAPLDLPAAARWGGEGPFVVEACEYDHSFLQLAFDVGAIVAVAADHLDSLGDLAGVHEAFARFGARARPGGVLVAGAAVPPALVARLAARVPRLVRAGETVRLDGARGPGGAFAGEAACAGRRAPLRLRPPGAHNVENLRVALAVVDALGIPLAAAARAAGSFTGVARRLQDLGETVLDEGTARIVDDFAHHPDEIGAAHEALSAAHRGRRLVVAYQPHQVSRTDAMRDELARALAAFDEVLLCDVFEARDGRPGRADAATRRLARAVASAGGRVRRVGRARRAAPALRASLRDGDLCVVMGAGDIDGVARRLVAAPARPRA